MKDQKNAGYPTEKEKVDPVKYELHMDYTLAYDYYDAKTEQNKQNKERRGI